MATRFIPTSVIVSLLLLEPASAQAPPFNTNVELKGSTIYNGIIQTDDPFQPLGDWFIDRIGTTGTIRMDANGLVHTPGTIGSGTTSIQHQLKREYHVEDGVARASFRLTFSNVNQIGFFAGIYARIGATGEPIQAAYFRKPAGQPPEDDTKVDLVTHDGTGDPIVQQDKFPVANNAPFDIVVEVDGSAIAGNKVTFWWRATPSDNWSQPFVVTSDVPLDTAKLHFSVRVYTNVGGGTNASLTEQLYEYTAPAPDEDQP